jgi:peptidoglycan/LPS O-acetylase OafA/YrhL
VTRYGYLGVELFFIISGYVVLLSAQGKTVRQFFLSRVTRLYPAFWVACTLTFLMKLLWGPGPADAAMSPQLHAGPVQYAVNLTMLPEFLHFGVMDGAYWSLTIEIIFYLLVAILIGFDLLKHLTLVIALWLAYTALPGAVREGTLLPEMLFPAYAPFFAAGMLLYLMQQPQGRTWPRYGLLLLAYLLGLRASVGRVGSLALLYHESFSKAVVAATITVFFVVMALVAFRKVDLSRFAWLAWLGALTYPLYLLHSDIGFIIFHRLQHAANKYVLVGGTFVLMLVAAYLVHVFIEKRLSKVLGRQVNRLLDALAK